MARVSFVFLPPLTTVAHPFVLTPQRTSRLQWAVGRTSVRYVVSRRRGWIHVYEIRDTRYGACLPPSLFLSCLRFIDCLLACCYIDESVDFDLSLFRMDGRCVRSFIPIDVRVVYPPDDSSSITCFLVAPLDNR